MSFLRRFIYRFVTSRNSLTRVVVLVHDQIGRCGESFKTKIRDFQHETTINEAIA
jgi:hypothetical protein